VAYDEVLADRIRELVAGGLDVTERKMFGGLAFLVASNMSLAASGQSGFIVHVDPQDSCEHRVMPGDLELAAVAALRRALPDAHVHRDSPDWLKRPGRVECGPRWDFVQSVYRALTQRDLCETMPSRERRQIDAVIEREGEPPRIFEFDESQHFNAHRAVTLRLYPDDVETAFPLERWLSASETSTKKLGTTGGWGKAKPPLFPEPGGRHVQRAFRDALADLLPAVHGWAPTLRVADFEVQEWIHRPQAGALMGDLLEDRLK